nr:uncharacterized protein LOC109168059 [Ipomoea batatas]
MSLVDGLRQGYVEQAIYKGQEYFPILSLGKTECERPERKRVLQILRERSGEDERAQSFIKLHGISIKALRCKCEISAFAQFSASMNAVHGKWMRSNKMCLNLMKITMAENMKPMMPKVDIASEFLAKVKELSMSEIADKSIAGNLMAELTSVKFDWSVPIHDHCDQMVNIAAKLKGMGMKFPESWLVHLVINSLPPAEFGQFRVNYNTLKEKWSF